VQASRTSIAVSVNISAYLCNIIKYTTPNL